MMTDVGAGGRMLRKNKKEKQMKRSGCVRGIKYKRMQKYILVQEGGVKEEINP